jgi:pyruvate/2-oxoglutarate dehydrogenase complex dihydrolipoamide dehydrogenase (E3) component
MSVNGRRLLVATGRRAQTDALNLAAAGVAVDERVHRRGHSAADQQPEGVGGR